MPCSSGRSRGSAPAANLPGGSHRLLNRRPLRTPPCSCPALRNPCQGGRVVQGTMSVGPKLEPPCEVATTLYTAQA
jgi:hypothetical protein